MQGVRATPIDIAFGVQGRIVEWYKKDYDVHRHNYYSHSTKNQ